MSGDTLQRVAAFLSDALRPFVSSLGSDDETLAFIEELGWTLPLVPPCIPALGSSGNAVIGALTDAEIAADALDDGSGDEDALAQALVKLVAALGDFALQTREMRTKLAEELPAAFVTTTGIANTFQKRLFEDLVVRAISARAPLGTAVAGLAGIVEEVEVEADPARFQPDYTSRTLRLDRIGLLLNDPRMLLHEVYGWGTPTLDLDRLFTNVQRVSYPLLGPMEVRYPSNELLASTAPGAPILEEEGPPPAYTIPIYEGGPITIVLAVMPLPKMTPQELQGIAITLALELKEETSLTLGPLLTLTPDGTLDLSSGAAAVLRPDRDPTIVLNPEGSSVPLTGKGGVRLSLADPDAQATRLLTFPGGSFLEATELYFAAGVDATAGPPDVYVEAGAEGSTLTIAASGVDSFLASILPKDGLTIHFDFGVEWSKRGGLRFSGGARLDTTIPLGVTLGPFTVQSTHVELTADGDGITLEFSASGSAMVGPINASVDRLGIMLQSAFSDGNLGLVNMVLGFKPPSGLGLAIDSPAVVGGGYLNVDPQKGEYSGNLQLEIVGKISVKAFGLLSTKLPDGAPGYALIVFITAEDFQPIQLGMGFKLEGIGGMFAVNRTFDEAAMREGLKNKTLETLLFPQDPVANAPQILRNLGTVFPINPGSYIFGPMAKIGWATPTLITMDMAIMLEFGLRRRLIVLGRISAMLPNRDDDLIRLNMDAMGVLDLDVGTLALDAVLVDSRLLHEYVLTGSMAMRACVVPGSQAGLCLAVGGVNPHFTPPANLPKLDRITINLTSGDNPRFTCEAYFAVTANTVQFGSRASLHAAAYGFSIDGEVGFDVLVRLLPFHFIADYWASIQLKHGSTNLFKVKVEGELEGPLPLRLSAKATFEILWCDYSIHFDKTLVGGDKPPLPPAVDALEELKRALSSPDNWKAQIPVARQHGLTMRKLPANAPLALDPLGQLSVRQSVVPLNTNRDVDTFGGAPIGGARRFTITMASLNGSTQAVGQDTQDMFAPAQFFDLSDDERLASPSFEMMDNGVVFGSEAISIEESLDQRVYAPLEYDTIVVNADGTDEKPPDDYVLGANRFFLQAQFASVAKASIRTTGLGKFSNTRVAPAVKLANPGWRIVSTSDLNTTAPSAAPLETFADASASVKALNKSATGGAASWQLIPGYEIAF